MGDMDHGVDDCNQRTQSVAEGGSGALRLARAACPPQEPPEENASPAQRAPRREKTATALIWSAATSSYDRVTKWILPLHS